MRMLRGAVAVLLAGLVCSACTAIPTTGQVLSETRRTTGEGQDSITVVPDPPPQGASPAMIVTGFLTAMSSLDAGYDTARLYLTTDAGSAWEPTSQMLIYSGATPRVTSDQVTMEGALMGYLEADGSFTGSEERLWNHDFEMVQEDGEWRISNPPQGLALSQYMFSQRFTRIDTYFFAASRTTLVPDPRYVPGSTLDLTTAAGLVLAGPSQWLRPIVDDRIWQGITLAGDVTVSAQGLVSIPLSDQALRLSSSQATRLAVEIAATIRDLRAVNQISLTCGGAIVALDGASEDGALPLSAVEAFDSRGPGSEKTVVAAVNGLLTKMDSLNGPRLIEWEWDSMSPIDSFALRGDDQIAVVTEEGLWVGPPGGAARLVLSATGLLKPQYDAAGNIWVVLPTPTATVAMVKDDDVVYLDTTGLTDMVIRGFQVSPDGQRIVLVREVDSSTETSPLEIGIGLISYEGTTPKAIVSWKPIRLIWGGTSINSIVDVAWVGPSSLLLLGSSGVAAPGVFFTDIDGLELDEWGLPRAWNPVELAVNNTSASLQVMVLDSEGTIWSYDGGYAWRVYGEQASAIAFPS